MRRRHRQYWRGNRGVGVTGSGSSARQAHKSETSPVDLCVLALSMRWCLAVRSFSTNKADIMNQQDIEQVVKAVLLKMQAVTRRPPPFMRWAFSRPWMTRCGS